MSRSSILLLMTVGTFARIIYAKLAGRPLGMSHDDDVDGIVSGALFLRKYGNGVLVLADPRYVGSSPLYRMVRWDYVSDLPCPGKVRLWVDHHGSNTPCGDRNYHDPEAPCAAVLAVKALGLEGDETAVRLASLASETDTANIRSEEAWLLHDAVRGAPLGGRYYIARELGRRGLEVLDDPKVRGWIEANRERRRRTERIASRIPLSNFLYIVFERDVGIDYRGMCIGLEKRGALAVAIVVPRKGGYRYYLGARRGSGYDVSTIATTLGGGGHPFAAGAMAPDPMAGLPLFRKMVGNGTKVYRVTGEEEVVEVE